jgi:hypothetical protein
VTSDRLNLLMESDAVVEYLCSQFDDFNQTAQRRSDDP